MISLLKCLCDFSKKALLPLPYPSLIPLQKGGVVVVLRCAFLASKRAKTLTISVLKTNLILTFSANFDYFSCRQVQAGKAEADLAGGFKGTLMEQLTKK